MGAQGGMGGGGGAPARGNHSEGEVAGAGFDRTKAGGTLGEGEIIGSFFVRGVPPKGPAETKYVEILGQYEHEASQALEKEPIPAGQRDQVKQYFDSLKPPPEAPPAK